MWDFYCSQKDFNFNIFDERQDKNKKLKLITEIKQNKFNAWPIGLKQMLLSLIGITFKTQHGFKQSPGELYWKHF